MTWTRLSDDFNDRPEVVRLSRSARLLHVEALVWCNRMLTDGVLPDHMVHRVTDSGDLDRDLAELVDAGLWTRLESDDGWQIDWADQETAEAVKERRAGQAARQRAYNDRRKLHAKDDHSKCGPSHCPALRRDASRNTSADAGSNPSDDGLPSRPVPSRPEGEGQGQRTGTGGSAADGGSAGATHAASATPPYPGGLPPGVVPSINGKKVRPRTDDMEVER